MLSLYLTFAFSITLLIASPGPIISLVIADSKHGWPTGTILGGAISALLLLIVSSLLIHFALEIDAHLLDVGRVVGGGYLLYLGVKVIRSEVTVKQTSGHHRDCFWRTMKAGVANPKDILFFLAFLPSFIVPDVAFTQQAVTLLSIWAVIDMLIMVAYAGLAKKLLTYRACQTGLHYMPGIFMMVVGGVSLLLGVNSLLSL